MHSYFAQVLVCHESFHLLELHENPAHYMLTTVGPRDHSLYLQIRFCYAYEILKASVGGRQVDFQMTYPVGHFRFLPPVLQICLNLGNA